MSKFVNNFFGIGKKMKWTTQGLQQDVLVEMNMDTIDVTILRYIIDFLGTNKMYIKIIDNKLFFWINYQTIINDLPILKIDNRRAIARRFDKYVDCNLMIKNVTTGTDVYLDNGNELKRQGTFTYFHINPEKLEYLLGGVLESTGGCTPEYRGVDSKVQEGCNSEYNGGVLESTTKDSSNKDYSIIDNINGSKSKKYIDSFNFGDTTYYFYKDPNSIYICKGDQKGITKTPEKLFDEFKRYKDHPVLSRIYVLYGIK